MKTALITGASRGLGLEFTRQFYHDDWKVIATCRDPGNADELNSIGDVNIYPLDVTYEKSVASLADKLRGETIDVLINNAGLSGRGLISEIAEDTIDALLNVNLKGVIICAKVFAPILKNANDAVMINMSSQAGKRGWAELSVYGATKAGVLGMNRALAVELAPEVRVNAICPGYISEVGMAWRGWDSKSKKEGGDAGSIGTKFAIDNIPLERLQTADDIARSAVFLGSTDAKEITGAALNVGGGVVMD